MLVILRWCFAGDSQEMYKVLKRTDRAMIPANGVTRDTNVFRSFQREPGKEKMSEIGVGQR